MKLRLDKYLCDMGFGTRTEVKKQIARGQAEVNGAVEKDAGRKVDTEADRVSFCGAPAAYCQFEYYMLHKPAGVISASRADVRNKGETCVVDLIESKRRKDLFPVGRLDKDTEGLLLITNDGALAHALLSPKKHVWKTYYAELAKPFSEADRERLRAGVEIGDDTPTLPCRVEAVSLSKMNRYAETGDLEEMRTSAEEARLEELAVLAGGEAAAAVLISIREGRYHQIKRMAEAVGNEVVYLKRLSMGSLRLDENLSPGSFRELSEEELAALKAEGRRSSSGKCGLSVFCGAALDCGAGNSVLTFPYFMIE